MAVPAPRASGPRIESKPAESAAPDGRPRGRPRPGLFGWFAPRERKTRELGARLARAQERIKELELELYEMRDYIERLEAKLKRSTAASSGRKSGKTGSRAAVKKSAPSKSARRPRKRAPQTKAEIDLNTASFEQLRSVGLSVTESARLIAHRDTRKGYEDLRELDEIPGLSAEAVGTLREHVRLQE
jgi:DNA uptake protein ComE-like DNA-binding protein